MPRKPPSTGPVPTSEARQEHQDGRIVTVPAPPPIRSTSQKPAAAKEPAVPSTSQHTVKITADTSKLQSGLGSAIPKLAPGETTTEFALTVVGAICAVVLACFGKIDGTAALAAVTAAVAGYSVSRGLAKR